MAELHIDSDWKKQAQEEKKRLAEQEAAAKAKAAAPVAPAGAVATSATAPAAAAGGRAAGGRRGRASDEMPEAGVGTLVQSLVTQVLYYLGDVAARGMEPMVNFEMAKHNLDTLGVLEEKTKGNLTPEEQQMLDAALYETRMRYIGMASRYAELP